MRETKKKKMTKYKNISIAEMSDPMPGCGRLSRALD
jgi:hypothetical protein